jgi:hypothetical protein
MIDYTTFRLMHRHGNEYEPMDKREHGSADHDPERAWIRGARIFKCRTCDEEVVLVPPNNESESLPDALA